MQNSAFTSDLSRNSNYFFLKQIIGCVLRQGLNSHYWTWRNVFNTRFWAQLPSTFEKWKAEERMKCIFFSFKVIKSFLHSIIALTTASERHWTMCTWWLENVWELCLRLNYLFRKLYRWQLQKRAINKNFLPFSPCRKYPFERCHQCRCCRKAFERQFSNRSKMNPDLTFYHQRVILIFSYFCRHLTPLVFSVKFCWNFDRSNYPKVQTIKVFLTFQTPFSPN